MGNPVRPLSAPKVPGVRPLDGNLEQVFKAIRRDPAHVSLPDEEWKRAFPKAVGDHLRPMAERGRRAVQGDAEWLQDAQGGSTIGQGQWVPFLQSLTLPNGHNAAASGVSILETTPAKLADEIYGKDAGVMWEHLHSANKKTPVGAHLPERLADHTDSPVFFLQLLDKSGIDPAAYGRYHIDPRVGVFGSGGAKSRATDVHEAGHAIREYDYPMTASDPASWRTGNVMNPTLSERLVRLKALEELGFKEVPDFDAVIAAGGPMADALKRVDSAANLAERMTGSAREMAQVFGDMKRDHMWVTGSYPKSPQEHADLFRQILMGGREPIDAPRVHYQYGPRAGQPVPKEGAHRDAVRILHETMKKKHGDANLMRLLWETSQVEQPNGPLRA